MYIFDLSFSVAVFPCSTVVLGCLKGELRTPGRQPLNNKSRGKVINPQTYEDMVIKTCMTLAKLMSACKSRKV